MSSTVTIADLVRDPSRLVETCREVIDALQAAAQNGGGNQKEAQLREIAKAVERLERAGVPVPDSLRAEKTKLVAELAVMASGTEALKQLADDLDGVLDDLRARLGQDDSEATPQSPRPKANGGDKPKKKRSRAARTDKKILRLQITAALKKLGGKGRIKDIMEEMGAKLEGKLLPGDLEWRETSDEYVWQNNTKWERFRMIQDGLARSDSPRGVWELSENHQ